jgi:hypothetical protein
MANTTLESFDKLSRLKTPLSCPGILAPHIDIRGIIND